MRLLGPTECWDAGLTAESWRFVGCFLFVKHLDGYAKPGWHFEGWIPWWHDRSKCMREFFDGTCK